MGEVNKTELGNRIKDIRMKKGMSLEKFAETYFNTGASTVRNWEIGRHLPNKERLIMLTKIGEMSLEELLYGSSKEQLFKEENLKLWLIVEKNITEELINIKIMESENSKLSEKLTILQDISNTVSNVLTSVEQGQYEQVKNELNSIIESIDHAVIDGVESMVDIEERTRTLERQLELAREKISEYIKKS